MFQKQDDSTKAFSTPPMQSQRSDDVETVVGPSVEVEGDFASEGNITVKGTVSGSVKTSKLLRAEEGSKILANVRAANAAIAGHIKGNINVSEKLELSSTAQILGDISCAVLEVAPGALIQGKVSMKGLAMSEDDNGKKSVTRRLRSKKASEPDDQEDAA